MGKISMSSNNKIMMRVALRKPVLKVRELPTFRALVWYDSNSATRFASTEFLVLIYSGGYSIFQMPTLP